jgi:hypothetical protein
MSAIFCVGSNYSLSSDAFKIKKYEAKEYVDILIKCALNAGFIGLARGKFSAIILDLGNRLTALSLLHTGEPPVNYTTD